MNTSCLLYLSSEELEGYNEKKGHHEKKIKRAGGGRYGDGIGGFGKVNLIVRGVIRLL